MNEVEKMYENAGFVKKRCKDYSCGVCEQYNIELSRTNDILNIERKREL